MVQDNESHFKEPVKYYTGFEMTLSLLKPKKNPRVFTDSRILKYQITYFT